MANNTVASIFYKEVVDAIARTSPPDSDLIVLKDLCTAVDASDRRATSPLTRSLVQLSGTETRLHDISYELYYALMARMLVEGWFDEFDLVLDWDQTIFSNKNERTADKWEGIVGIVAKDPRSLKLSGQVDHEKEFQRALNGFEGVIRHFAKVPLPRPSTMGAPPEPPPRYETALPEALGDAIEAFFRALQMVFQQQLELALARLERDSNDAIALRKLQRLQITLTEFLDEVSTKLSPDRASRGLRRTIRIAEVRYGRGRGKQHRFLDAFPPNDSRSVIFNSLDRDDNDQPFVRGDKLRNIHKSRNLQLAFYLSAYGHPLDPNGAPSAWHTRRRALIKTKHGGRLKLSDNDDFVAFLSNFFDDGLDEIMRRASSLSMGEAGVLAWRATIDLYSMSLGQLTSHSRLNLTEGPPNYLTHAFPRNLGGRLFHDCGVYGVRTAFTLLSVFDQIQRVRGDIAGTVLARWVRFPLHVGVVIQSSTFGLVVEHNDHLFAIDNDNLSKVRSEWLTKPPDPDPVDRDAATLKFHEDIAASAFSSDLDMPVTSVPLLEPGEAVTKQTIWNSYQKKVVPSQLFTRVVGATNAPQYQFDLRYLKLSEEEREWYNRAVVPFWNGTCNAIWNRFKKDLTDPARSNNTPAPTITQGYVHELRIAMDALLETYKAEIKPKKQQLSEDLRADKTLLMPGVRIVRAVRISTVLPAVTKLKDHIDEISRPAFKFTADFVPPFARPEEELLEVP